FMIKISFMVPQEKEIHDIHQYVWVLQGSMLVAVPNDETVKAVTLEEAPCRDDNLENGKGIPIYIGIKGRDICLACEMSGKAAVLQLLNKKIWDLYQSKEAQLPFVFYRNYTGSTHTLESAACPGWFICTSREQNQPVKMTQNLGKHNTAFYLN
uniref:Interleukin-1 n=1 Tax=Monodelphis domestica TaxID=13616 RepID=A0A5F8H255_MONDO